MWLTIARPKPVPRPFVGDAPYQPPQGGDDALLAALLSEAALPRIAVKVVDLCGSLCLSVLLVLDGCVAVLVRGV